MTIAKQSPWWVLAPSNHALPEIHLETVTQRLGRVRSMNRAELREALAWQGTQTTVAKVAAQRLAKLERVMG